jgi:hypothetical protein
MQDSTDLSFALFRQQPLTTPELHSQMLLGCGEVGVAGILRRRIRA